MIRSFFRVTSAKNSLPELPDKKKDRFIKEYGLSAYEANILVSEKEISDYYTKEISDYHTKEISRSRSRKKVNELAPEP